MFTSQKSFFYLATLTALFLVFGTGCGAPHEELSQEKRASSYTTQQDECIDGVCTSKKALSFCVPGSMRCKNSKVQKCKSGKWKTISTCNYGCYKTNGKAYCKCSNNTTAGQTYCVGLNVYVCQLSTNPNGSGSPSTTCNSNQYCSNGTCYSCVCSPGTTRCNGNDIEVCNSSCSGWTVTSTCSSNQYCSNGTCSSCVCSPGAKRCNGNDVETCNPSCSGWTVSSTCSSTQYCDAGTCYQCVCSPGATRCNGNDVETCNSSCSGWTVTASCPNSCSNGVCH